MNAADYAKRKANLACICLHNDWFLSCGRPYYDREQGKTVTPTAIIDDSALDYWLVRLYDASDKSTGLWWIKVDRPETSAKLRELPV